MHEALVAACDRVDADPAIQVFVPDGGPAAKRSSLLGTDISQFQNFSNRDDQARCTARSGWTACSIVLERVAKPTIAQVEGVAAGGGCAIALTCDLRVATPDATFGIPIARTLGNCLSGATYSRLLDAMGPGAVKDMLFTGRLIGAAEAQTLGLVSRLVSSTEIASTVRELAATIASNAPLTIRATKEMVRRVLAHRRLPAGADADMVELCYTSADFREGVTAFVSKRKPEWSGR